MPSAKFEMCSCGRHGIFTRPSGIVIKIHKKQEGRDRLKDLWKAKQTTTAEYMEVRTAIENSTLPDGGAGFLQPDDPMIDIMNASQPPDVFQAEYVAVDPDLQQAQGASPFWLH